MDQRPVQQAIEGGGRPRGDDLGALGGQPFDAGVDHPNLGLQAELGGGGVEEPAFLGDRFDQGNGAVPQEGQHQAGKARSRAHVEPVAARRHDRGELSAVGEMAAPDVGKC